MDGPPLIVLIIFFKKIILIERTCVTQYLSMLLSKEPRSLGRWFFNIVTPETYTVRPK